MRKPCMVSGMKDRVKRGTHSDRKTTDAIENFTSATTSHHRQRLTWSLYAYYGSSYPYTRRLHGKNNTRFFQVLYRHFGQSCWLSFQVPRRTIKKRWSCELILSASAQDILSLIAFYRPSQIRSSDLGRFLSSDSNIFKIRPRPGNLDPGCFSRPACIFSKCIPDQGIRTFAIFFQFGSCIFKIQPRPGKTFSDLNFPVWNRIIQK